MCVKQLITSYYIWQWIWTVHRQDIFLESIVGFYLLTFQPKYSSRIFKYGWLQVSRVLLNKNLTCKKSLEVISYINFTCKHSILGRQICDNTDCWWHKDSLQLTEPVGLCTGLLWTSSSMHCPELQVTTKIWTVINLNDC